MDRKETTKLLTDILIADRLSDRKYYAKEVTLDYGTDHPKRVDVMQFTPNGVMYPSDIEKGIFTCYEVKSCKEDIYSGNGIGFYGEKNYFVMTTETFKEIQGDINNGNLGRFIKEYYPESSGYYGILCPVPKTIDLRDGDALYEEYMNPTEFRGTPYDWHLNMAITCFTGHRRRSMAELLFCMLRSKHSYTNQRDFL
jgi:hypothetical protein